MLLGAWGWLLGLLLMLLLPMLFGEVMWRRFLDRIHAFERRPGVLSFSLLFGLVGPPVSLAAFLLLMSWFERDLSGARPATELLAALLAFAYMTGGIPALICGGILGALRRRLRSWQGLLGAVILGAVLLILVEVLTGRGAGLATGRAALLGVATGCLASGSIAYGCWRRGR